MKPIIPIYEKILRYFFKEYYLDKDFKDKKRKEFLEKYPCTECRPDGCTFYYDIKCNCVTCGRIYYI